MCRTPSRGWPKAVRKRRNISMERVRSEVGRESCLRKRMLHIRISVGCVQTEDLARVDHERDDTRNDQDGNEQRRNWVEACPPIVLNEQRRDDDSNRPEGVLSGRHQRCKRAIAQELRLTAMTCRNTPRMLSLWPSCACVLPCERRFGPCSAA